MKTAVIVGAYLAAIIAANLAAAAFGPGATVVSAFVLIAFDLTARDALHDRWRGRWLWPRMAGLIVAGGALSFVVNVGAGQIALASLLAFTLAGVVDAVVYQACRSLPWLARSNVSNVASSVVDSLVFPTVAFGAFLPLIVAGQIVAKIGGGAVWSLVLRVVSIRNR